MKDKIVYIVHAVDTEGPLYESIESTFKRMKDIFGIDNIDPTYKNLLKIQKKEIDLKGIEDEVAKAFSSKLLQYNDSWGKIDKMLHEIMSKEYRKKVPDSFNNGWIYNWHCLDHVGYISNPRRRDIGFHKIFDHYKKVINDTNSRQDRIHWHFHYMPLNKNAHRCGKSLANSPHLYETLCRRIIERDWFPTVYRSGFQTERPDINLFLEQWIPFDVTNMAIEDSSELESQKDLQNGRFGDWRIAPNDWSIYHPSHDNYQIKGNCRRWIGRALNLNTRIANINQKETDKAFYRANNGYPTLLGVTNHDFRNMKEGIENFLSMIKKSSEKFPKVKFKYSEAVQAFRDLIFGPNYSFEPLELNIRLKNSRLRISTKKGEVFGPQPFLAIKTRAGQFFHDNFDFGKSLKDWYYCFDEENLLLSEIETIGIAANDRYGNTFLKKINIK